MSTIRRSGRPTSPRPAGGPVIWADNGQFWVAGDSRGNPGCDLCGSADAVVKIGSTYLCVDALGGPDWRAALERWRTTCDSDPTLEPCDECGATVGAYSGMSACHDEFCSLHPGGSSTPRVPAEASDSRRTFSVRFDAAGWLHNAEPAAVAALAASGYTGDPARAVAATLAQSNVELDALLRLCATNRLGPVHVDVRIDGSAARRWLSTYRPDVI